MAGAVSPRLYHVYRRGRLLMIVYFTNFLSPHVKPFCDYLYEHTQGAFLLVETMAMSEERKAMGYASDREAVPYIRKCLQDRREWESLADTADCILINPGSTDFALTAYCAKSGKVVFFTSERLFKWRILKLLDRRLWKQLYINLKSRKKPVYLLCFGSNVAKDFVHTGFCKEKAFRFGYFPESRYASVQEEDKEGLLWVGRMIGWKRPIFALKVVEHLKNQGLHYHLNLVGDGVLMQRTKRYAEQHGLLEHVSFHGLLENDKVRELMCRSSAYLMTSTRREGWGAVINEALDAGLPVVSASEAGASGYLIKDGINGFLFPTYSVKKAAEAVQRITPQNRRRLGKAAKDSLEVWNGQEAGKRFLQVLSLIEGGASLDVYSDGPMSKAI